MEELFAIKDVYKLYEGNQMIVMFCIMLIALYPLLIIIKRLLFPGINKIADNKGKSYSKIIKKHKLTSNFVHVFISVYLLVWSDIFDRSNLLSDIVIRIKDIFVSVYATVAITLTIITIINIAVDIYKTKDVSKRLPIGLHSHILKIIISICATLIVISHVLNMSIAALFTSLGAAAALLTFVFKDTVLGLLASLQVTFQGIVRVGDWITVPQYNADGDVEKITITVVVIRNFDKTVTTVPTSALLTTGIQNWRAMQEAGGRRIKRAINIDMDTIKICNQSTLNKFKNLKFMNEFVPKHKDLFDAKNNVTNITIFRYYLMQYLKHHQSIHKKGFTFLVRQLAPTQNGMPIELYVFTNDTDWIKYEGIQADIFDHILGTLPEFGLRAFQSVIK